MKKCLFLLGLVLSGTLSAQTLTDGLIAYYPFDGNWNDQSGQGNHLINHGATFGTDLNGVEAHAAKFSSLGQVPPSTNFGNSFGGQWLEVGNKNMLASLTSLTVSFWAQLDFFLPQAYGNASSSKILYKESLASIGYTGNGQDMGFTMGNGVSWFGQAVIVTNSQYGIGNPTEWFHFAFVADSSGQKLYINGTLVPQNGAAIQALGTNSYILGIGSHFNGRIDEMQIFNRALSGQEVLALYAQESGQQFIIVQGSYTWNEAKADAEARGGRLAVIDGPEKELKAEELISAYSSRKEFYIGLSYLNGVWTWVNGELLVYENWGPDEPNDIDVGDHFTSITTGGWGPLQFGDWNNHKESGSAYRAGYILEIGLPNPPVLKNLTPLIEPKLGDTATLDAAATSGFPVPSYQWYYEGFPISAASGGTNPVYTFTATLSPSVEGVYRCVATNSEGSAEVQTRVVLFRDDDNDGLSNYREDNITLTDKTKADTDGDGLKDGVEVNDTMTNPNDPDSDDDGLSDYVEVYSTNTNPNDPDSDDDGSPDNEDFYPNDPTRYLEMWGKYFVTDGYVNAEDWLGWLYIGHSPWVYSFNDNLYFYIPEDTANNGRGWLYSP